MIPVPFQPLEDREKVELSAAIRAGSERGHALACLWLHFCHLARVSPYAARPGGQAYRDIDRVWAPTAAKLTGGCSHALSTHLSSPTAIKAASLYQQALEARQATAQSPSLF